MLGEALHLITTAAVAMQGATADTGPTSHLPSESLQPCKPKEILLGRAEPDEVPSTPIPKLGDQVIKVFWTDAGVITAVITHRPGGFACAAVTSESLFPNLAEDTFS